MTSSRPHASRILISGGHILTMDPAIGDVPCGDVLIEDGRITAVGEHGGIHAPTGGSPADLEILDASGTIVIPGFIDGHRHLWQSLLRGVASDWSLSEYMEESRARYASCFDPECAYLSTLLGGLESLSAGITTVVDHAHLQSSPEVSDALANGLLDSGVGGFFCYALQNAPGYPSGLDAAETRDLLARPPDDWHDGNAARIRDTWFADVDPRLRFGVALPEATPFLPAVEGRQLVARATALSPALLTGHWPYSGSDGLVAELYGGMSRHIPICLSHGNGLHDSELALMAESGVSVCTTPEIECGMGLGRPAALRFRRAGGKACVGTDLSAYARADIVAQARLLLQVERQIHSAGSPTPPEVVSWTVRDALALATRDGAEALGLGAEVGTVSAGKRADVVLVRPDPIGAEPVGDPAATVLFATSPAEIDTVVVHGEIVKRDGVLRRDDLDELRRAFVGAAARVRARYDDLPAHEGRPDWSGLIS
jgi:cytosine/adenosine deaminase-related metal-dependent hydrolase